MDVHRRHPILTLIVLVAIFGAWPTANHIDSKRRLELKGATVADITNLQEPGVRIDLEGRDEIFYASLRDDDMREKVRRLRKGSKISITCKPQHSQPERPLGPIGKWIIIALEED